MTMQDQPLPQGVELTPLDERVRVAVGRVLERIDTTELDLIAALLDHPEELARAEAQEAILALIMRVPALRHSPRGGVHHAIPSFRGLQGFLVRTGPR